MVPALEGTTSAMPAPLQSLLSIPAAHLGSGTLQPTSGGVPASPVPLPPLATSDGFISLAARTVRLQLGFHRRI